jgi:hypothetical protein
MGLQVNSVPLPETIERLPRRATVAASSRATRRPEIEVSGIAPRHSLVMSSTMLRTRKRRPLRTDHKRSRATSARSAPLPPESVPRLRPPCGASVACGPRVLLPIEPVDAIDPFQAVFPASIVNTVPVTLRPPSPSKYSTMRATSSGWASRRNALRPAMRWR